MAYVDPTVVNVGAPPASDLAPAQVVGYSPDANALMPQPQQQQQGGEIEQYIRRAAIQRGIDPDIAVRVAAHEGLHAFDPSKPDAGGDEGSSFGPYQLHYAGMSKSMPHAGLGDEFTAATGLDARDPSTWKQQVDFSLDQAAKSGWGPWMGAKAAGVTGMMGIGGAGRPDAAPLQMAGGLGGGQPLSPMGGNAAVPSATNQFPPQPQAANMGGASEQMRRMMTLLYLKSAMNGVQLQRVDYDPWAVIGGKSG